MIKKFFPVLFFIICILLFFYPVFLKGFIPFPGDLLVAEFKPWRTYSYLGYVPGSVPNKAQYPDTIRQLYPWKTLVVDSLKKFTLPLWNPYNFSGAPLLANFQSAAIYPGNIFYLLFSMPIAWSILIIMQPLLALLFAYLYARKIGVSKLAASFSAVTYAFSSFMTVWLEYNTVDHVILWLPLMLLSIEYLKDKFTVPWSLLFTGASVSALFAGHPQLFAYTIVLVFVYGMFRFKSWKQKIYFSILFLVSLGLGGLQLAPGIELILQSARSPHPFDTLFQKILIQPWQLIMAIVPDFFGNPATRNYWPLDTYIGKVTYIGLVPFLFYLAAFRIKNNFFVKFYAWLAGIILILVTANPITYILYRLPIPFFATSAPTLMVFLFCFAGALLAGLGMDAWTAETHSVQKLIKRLAVVAGGFVILWIIVFMSPHLATAKRPLLYSTMLFSALLILYTFAFLKPKKMKLAIFGLICFQIIDLFLFFKKFTPFAPVEFIYPKNDIFTFLQEKNGIGRFWGHSSAYVEANVNAVDKLYSTEGYDPLYPKWYGEFIQSSKDGKIHEQFTDQTRSDASIAPSTGNEDIGRNMYRLRVIDSLGVSTILDRNENASTEVGFPSNRYRLMYQKNEWKAYENLKAAPRFFLTSDYKLYDSTQSFSDSFFAKTFNPSETIVLTENPGFTPSLRDKAASAVIQGYTPEDIRITTNAKETNLLFLSDTYYPGWLAFVDQTPTKIFKANWAFRAVVVPPGAHVVRFVYQPTSVQLGIVISGLSILVGIGFLYTISKRRRNEII